MTIKIKTGTRTQVTSAAAANTLVPTELIFVTNESKVEVATSGNTTAAVGGSSTSNVGDVVYAPSTPDSRWIACDGSRVSQNVYSDLFSLVQFDATPVNYPVAMFRRSNTFINNIFTPQEVKFSPDNKYFTMVYTFGLGTPFAGLFALTSANSYANVANLTYTGTPRSTSWSPDGSYLALGSSGNTVSLRIFDVTTGTPTTVQAPTTSGNVSSVAWSPAGLFVGTGMSVSPYVACYTWNGSGVTVMSNPGTLPTGTVLDTAWSANSRYLALAHETTPFVTIYDFNTGAPVKVSNPATLPTGNSFAVAWSPNGQYMAVGHTVTPFITIYNWATGSPVKITNPGVLPVANVEHLAWTPDGKYLTVHQNGAAGNTRFFLYDWTSGVPVYASAGSTDGSTGDWSRDGKVYVSIGRYQVNATSGGIFTYFPTNPAPALWDFYVPKITSTDGTRAFIKALPDSSQTIPFSGRIVPVVGQINQGVDVNTFYAPFYTDVVSSATVTVTRDVTLHHTFEREGGGLSTGMQRISTVINGVTSNVVTNSNTATDPLRTITAGSTLKYEAYHADYPVNGKMTVRLNDASGQIVETMYFRMGQSYN